MTRVAIVDGVRTPFAKAGTELWNVSPQELGRSAVRELIERTEIDPTSVDEVIVGNVAQPMDATNISRVIALTAGLPQRVSAHTVARNCASGMESVTEGFELIRAGRAHTIICGGAESMSNIPLAYPASMSRFLFDFGKARTLAQKIRVLFRFRFSMLRPVVALLEGLKDPFCGLNMGETAEVLAKEFHVSRDEQDAFALQSHQRAARAMEAGRFKDEMVPLYLPGRGDAVSADVGPRSHQTLEALAKLPPIFDRRHGTVTAGNSCGVTDGAAAVLLMSEERVRTSGVQPLAWIRSYAFGGLDPKRMGLGPAVAAPKALRIAGVTMKEIGLVEINEAFAAQVLAVLQVFAHPKLGADAGVEGAELAPIDPEILNVNGGAIALGHPVGATGTRITLTLAHEMKRRGVPLGLAALCVGGGQGGALVLERG